MYAVLQETIEQPIDLPSGLSELAIRLAPQILLDGDYPVTVLIAENPERKRYLAAALRQAQLRIRRDPPPIGDQLLNHPHQWTVYPGQE